VPKRRSADGAAAAIAAAADRPAVAADRPAERRIGLVAGAPGRARAPVPTLALALLLAVWPAAAPAQVKLLEPERAFAFAGRGLDDRTVEARFVVADGYYLYRDKLRFTLDGAVLATAPTLPPGKVKDDEFFGKVETYRGMVLVKLPLDAAAPGRPVTIRAESQGCADVGVCYPPQVQQITVTLPLAGGKPGVPVEAAPEKKRWFN
jgi:thiol:disulfide interchange protein DsbD